MKRVLAISGGVDSMVMLDILAQRLPKDEMIVAHFDHGIRANSDEDAKFVQRRAKEYGIGVVVGQGELGEGTSEEAARKARYEFLRRVAAEVGGEIYTAHHLDDLVGSVTINLVRGTGWRGLAVLNTPGIKRPFLDGYAELGFENPPAKKDLLRYAGEQSLSFREDQTNSQDEYLRNRLYHQMNNFNQKMEMFALWQHQLELRKEIDESVERMLPEETWQRSWFKNIDKTVAIEILRAGLLEKNITATRPQLREFLKAIREYAPGKYFNLPGDRLVRINSKDFSI